MRETTSEREKKCERERASAECQSSVLDRPPRYSHPTVSVLTKELTQAKSQSTFSPSPPFDPSLSRPPLSLPPSFHQCLASTVRDGFTPCGYTPSGSHYTPSPWECVYAMKACANRLLSHSLSLSLTRCLGPSLSLSSLLVVSLTHTLSLSPPLTRTSHDGPL